MFKKFFKYIHNLKISHAAGIRIRVTRLKIWGPKPLDDSAKSTTLNN